MITPLIIIFLVAMWAAVLAAPVVQNRGQQQYRGGDSLKSFQRQLATLDRTGGAPTRPALAQAPHHPGVGRLSGSHIAAQRRRRVFTVLGATAALTLVMAFLLGGPFVWLHLAADAVLVVYVAAVFHTMRSHAEREMNVAFLPHAETVAEPVVLLREVAQRR